MTDAVLEPVPAVVNLDTCDQEPIHIPGAIQSNGLLLAFDADRRLQYASANAAERLDPMPVLGEVLLPAHLGGCPDIHALLDEAFTPDARETVLPLSGEVSLGGHVHDLILHQSGDFLVAEFEHRDQPADELASFAAKAHRAMDRFKRQRSLEALLSTATVKIRELTGFDRVMAYRFRPDESGEVVAESVDERLDPFVGRRYPASDIPAQARRLYITNTLRLIVDVASRPVAIHGATGAPPLDLSQAVLRAVSPIHIEYLGNMGVGASMSVSIVVQGRLWGMIACHHMAARQVPYSVRMACDVIAQILAANVHTLLARGHGEKVATAADLRARMVEDLLHADDILAALAPHAPMLAGVFDAHAVVISEAGKVVVEGDLPAETARAIVRWLDVRETAPGALVAIEKLADFPADLRPLLGVWCGLLAICFDTVAGSWLLVLRKEQVETINWGGHPEKNYSHGPNGPRLTPRGSFALWRETVHGTAEAWDDTTLVIGQQLLNEMGRANAARVGELNRARNEFLAVLGHDLRAPLQSNSMAARVLEKAPLEPSGRLGQRIQSSSNRMQIGRAHV